MGGRRAACCCCCSLLLGLAAAGCAPEAGFRDAPAVTAADTGRAALPDAARADAEKAAAAFVAAVKAADADALRAALAAPPPAGVTPAAWLKAERLEPLARATDWTVDEVRPLGREGDRLLVRAAFRADGDPYRTNVTLTRGAPGAGGEGAPAWRVSAVLPPVKPTPPVGSAPTAGAEAPKVGG